MFTTAPEKTLVPARLVAARYDVCIRTVDRWLDQRILPPPVVINHRRYWYLTDLEKVERERMRLSATNTETTEPQALPDG